MKITVNEAKSEEKVIFLSKVEEKAKQFDFEALFRNVDKFSQWHDKLKKRLGSNMELSTPILLGNGESAYGYRFVLRPNNSYEQRVIYAIHCSTNMSPERSSKYKTFEGEFGIFGKDYDTYSDSERANALSAHAYEKRFAIKSVDDLTDELIDKIVAAVG